MAKKLFLLDYKHKQILGSIELKNVDQANQLIYFLNSHHVFNRYSTPTIAESVRVKIEDGESTDLIVEE